MPRRSGYFLAVTTSNPSCNVVPAPQTIHICNRPSNYMASTSVNLKVININVEDQLCSVIHCHIRHTEALEPRLVHWRQRQRVEDCSTIHLIICLPTGIARGHSSLPRKGRIGD